MLTPVEQIKERLSIVEVISGYLKLDKAGVNFKAKCPFHNEKTSSFFISPTRGTFHCFGCHKGGDVISFIQEIEGVEFKDALKLLADKAGIILPAFSGQVKNNDEAQTLKEILRQATIFYQQNLQSHKIVQEYLLNRGVLAETVERFNLGFALPDWRGVSDHLLAQGFKPVDIVATGLAVYKKDDRSKIYDRFRSRIMFPLKDSSGNVVGFSGRIYGEHPDEAKYINSPQTAVYDKSKILYGLDIAKVNIRRLDEAVLVEGQMDMIMAQQIGIDNAVAVSGTALTETHLTNLKRLSNNLVMAFDADNAGIQASKRAVEMALGLGLEVRIAVLPAGLDPADLAQTKPEQLKSAIKQSVHVIDFYLQVVSSAETDIRLRARRLKEEVYPLIDKLLHITDKAYFVKKIADLTNLNEEIIWSDLKNLPPGVVTNNFIKVDHQATENRVTRYDKIMKELLGIRFLLEENKVDWLTDFEDQISRIAGDLFMRAMIEKHTPNKDELILTAEVIYGTDFSKIKLLSQELLVNFEREFLKDSLTKVTTELKQAEATGDTALIDKTLKKCQDISNRINHL